MSVTGYTSSWNRNGGPSSRSCWATTAARLPPAESPPTAMRAGSIASSAAVDGSATQRTAATQSSIAAGNGCSGANR